MSVIHFPFSATPLQYHDTISRNLKINLFVKRDDLFELVGGGNKARKLQYIFPKILDQGYSAVITAGSSQSNHVRATALMCARFGIKCFAIIHDVHQSEPYKGNFKLTNLFGAQVIYCSKDDVSSVMDDQMEQARNRGDKPFYLWGGGHCLEGSFAYYEAIKELKGQITIKPDFILFASGTGATQAGIEVGTRIFIPKCKVLGISIARKKNRGINKIVESSNNLISYLNTTKSYLNKNQLNFLSNNDIFFDDKWIGDEYESVYPELIETINNNAKLGLLLDPTYTAKAFIALQNYVKSGDINKGSTVVFWHTGGLLNLLASKSI